MKFLKKYFDFNQGELYGILFLILSIITISIIVSFDLSENKNGHLFQHKAEVDTFIKEMNNNTLSTHKYHQPICRNNCFQNRKNKLNPFFFDPNNMKIKDWEKLGLCKKQIGIIVNYLNKGGKFKTKEDFSKMYSISKEDFQILEPYIQICDKGIKNTYTKKALPVFMVDFNASSIEELINIPGVGPSFAKRIEKYKERLGGYSDSTQLLEIFGMDTTKYLQLLPYFSFNCDSIKKKNLNTESFKQMIRHPYFSKSTAYLFIQYRQTKGDFKTMKDVRTALKNNDSIYRKISPYIKINN